MLSLWAEGFSTPTLRSVSPGSCISPDQHPSPDQTMLEEPAFPFLGLSASISHPHCGRPLSAAPWRGPSFQLMLHNAEPQVQKPDAGREVESQGLASWATLARRTFPFQPHPLPVADPVQTRKHLLKPRWAGTGERWPEDFSFSPPGGVRRGQPGCRAPSAPPPAPGVVARNRK